MSGAERKSGPVPVRDLMRGLGQDQEPPGSGAAAPGADEAPGDGGDQAPRRLEFRMGEKEWTARRAGDGAYGTGRLGAARLVAVHFYREDEPDVPVREALIPAGAFAGMRPEELRALFDRAVPIQLER